MKKAELDRNSASHPRSALTVKGQPDCFKGLARLGQLFIVKVHLSGQYQNLDRRVFRLPRRIAVSIPSTGFTLSRGLKATSSGLTMKNINGATGPEAAPTYVQEKLPFFVFILLKSKLFHSKIYTFVEDSYLLLPHSFLSRIKGLPSHLSVSMV